MNIEICFLFREIRIEFYDKTDGPKQMRGVKENNEATFVGVLGF